MLKGSKCYREIRGREVKGKHAILNRVIREGLTEKSRQIPKAGYVYLGEVKCRRRK